MGISPSLLQGMRGRLLCLFVCYGVQESRGAMDGGGGSCIEDGLAEGTGEASIRRSMRKEEGGR
jgi:hypothetical protein